MTELACLAIVAFYLATRLGGGGSARSLARRYALLAAGAWAAEQSCIRLYGFYAYAPVWRWWLGDVPLTVTLIWPVVILSAREIAQTAGLRGNLARAGAAAVVLADAALIEPTAVAAGLWSWTAPGVFGVPPIGLLGWAFFAGLSDRVVGALLGTHLLLLAGWWGALRWVSVPLPGAWAAGAAWILSAALAWRMARLPRERAKALRPVLLRRLPAAMFFWVLLALHGRGNPALVAWVLAFVPPYLVVLARGVLARSGAGISLRCSSPSGSASSLP